MPRSGLICTLMLLLVCPAATGSAQDADAAQSLITQHEFGATTVGSRILLLPDGTWITETPTDTLTVEAIADDGRRVLLTEQTDEGTGKVKRVWQFVGTGGGGGIQVVVNRTIQTDPSVHSDSSHCIPVFTIRNLSDAPLERIVAEVEFTDPENRRDSASVMMGPLDRGEEHTEIGPPLLLPRCIGLTADLSVPFCQFSNDLRCENLVVASPRGVIPLARADMADKAAASE